MKNKYFQKIKKYKIYKIKLTNNNPKYKINTMKNN